MRLYPRKQYGQFASAGAQVRTIFAIFGSLVGGAFMGHLTSKYGANGYHYMFLWQVIFHCLAVVCLWIVFIMWRHYGAEKFHYDPELRVEQRGFPVKLV